MLDYPVLELFKVDTFALGKQGDALEGGQVHIAHVIRFNNVGTSVIAIEVPQKSIDGIGIFKIKINVFFRIYLLGFLLLSAARDQH